MNKDNISLLSVVSSFLPLFPPSLLPSLHLFPSLSFPLLCWGVVVGWWVGPEPRMLSMLGKCSTMSYMPRLLLMYFMHFTFTFALARFLEQF